MLAFDLDSRPDARGQCSPRFIPFTTPKFRGITTKPKEYPLKQSNTLGVPPPDRRSRRERREQRPTLIREDSSEDKMRGHRVGLIRRLHLGLEHLRGEQLRMYWWEFQTPKGNYSIVSGFNVPYINIILTHTKASNWLLGGRNANVPHQVFGAPCHPHIH